jgi:multidrug efflux pump subunit AcrA (membrane-fusion protein)
VDIVRSRRRPALVRLAAPLAVLITLAGAVVCAVVLLRPQPSDPTIEPAAIVTDVAVRGDLVSAVRAPGTFVAEHVRVAAAPGDGTVESIPAHVGSDVRASTPIAQLSDPNLDAELADVSAQIAAARAELRSVQAEARAAQLDRQAVVAAALADYRQSREQALRYADLHAKGLVSDYDDHVAQIKAGEARDSVDFDERKIAVGGADAQAKAAVAQARITQLRAAYAAKTAQRAALTVRAGAIGVVQSIAVERGERVGAGTQIARIVDRRDLKVTLDVPEADVHDVVPGLAAVVEGEHGTIRGHVARVDPAAQGGVVAVDVALDADVPANARPDGRVDGTIELARLRNVVSIARPANAVENTSADMYRLVDGGTRALRTRVRFGRASPDRIEIVSGISAGTTVIVSDTSTIPDASTLRIR